MKRPDISKMTLRQKIAQTCVVRQSDLLMKPETQYSELQPEGFAVRNMKENQYGAVWSHGNVDVNQMGPDLYASFEFTPEKYLEWIKTLDEVSEIPFICANDPGVNVRGLSPAMTGLMVGAAGDEELAYELGRMTGLEQNCYGSNWIWAPMVDLLNRFSSGIIRPFSNKRDDLARLAAAYIKGMQSERVAATAKHFPGEDPYDTRDGHVIPTYLRSSLEEWEENQGKVFQHLIDSGVQAIMMATRAFPAVDDTKIGGKYLTAALSHKIVTGLLKEKMGFEGIVITDDVTMSGYTSFFPHEQLYVEFLKAGNDMLLGVGVDAVDLIEQGVLRGDLSEERIDDACRRIFDLKEKLGLFDDDFRRGVHNLEDLKPLTADVKRRISEKGVTLLQDENKLIPISRDKIKNVRIICYTMREYVTEKLKPLCEAFEKRGAKATVQRRLTSWDELREIDRENDLIVYVGYISFHAPKGAPSFYDDELWALRYAFTAGAEKSVGISLGYPHIHYDFMVECGTFANLYGLAPEAQEAFVAGLYGEIPFVGESPVDLSHEY